MAKKKTTDEQGPIEIAAMAVDMITMYIVGVTPIILNRMTEKAKHELLFPKGKKTAADKAANLKHNPIEEFRASAYRMHDADAETVLAVPATAIKSALRDAALSVPGAVKAEIGRLTWVPGELLSLYGIPKLHMSVTRNSDTNKTPDVRTRTIVPRWAIKVQISYVSSLIRTAAVANLLATAGRTIGIGDWRQGKGAGNYGQFRVCGAADQELREILQHGRADQELALEDAAPYDAETEELLGWFSDECRHRGVGA